MGTRSCHRRRNALVGVVLVLLTAACGGGSVTDREASSSKTSSASPGATEPDYIGPQVAFDVPDSWHEFNLDSPWDYFAAYGPVEGNRSDYVAIGPIPAELGDGSPEELLRRFVPLSSGPIDVEISHGNGSTMYTSSFRKDGLTVQATIVEGSRDSYLVACNYGTTMEADMSAGCASILSSLYEADPSPVTDPSGCTDRELSLLAGIPLWEGATPQPPDAGIVGVCDMWVAMPAGSREDVIRFYEGVLADEGWVTLNQGMDRTGPTGDVWQLLALQDWDAVLIEAYVTDGVTDHYFITVEDG